MGIGTMGQIWHNGSSANGFCDSGSFARAKDFFNEFQKSTNFSRIRESIPPRPVTIGTISPSMETIDPMHNQANKINKPLDI